jgi:hypothetical protein
MINRVCYDAYRQQQLRAGGAPSPSVPKLTASSAIPAVPRIVSPPASGRPSIAGSGSSDSFIHLRRADSVVQDDANIPSLLRGDSVLPGTRPESASVSSTTDDGKLVVESKDAKSTMTPQTSVEMNASGYVIISQADIYTHVFIPAIKLIPPSFLISCLTEYLRSIYRHYLNTEDYLNELLVSLLIADKRYYEFHQVILSSAWYHSRSRLLTGYAIIVLTISYPE